MNSDDLIYIAGHRGMVGSAIGRALRARGYTNILARTSSELDLCNQSAVEEFFSTQRPQFVFLAAATVGGIYANDTRAADFIRNNLLIQTNVIDAAYRHGTSKLLFLGSSCIYPKLAPQPIAEKCLLSGPLEETNQWYAIAKIAGLKMCQAYRRQHGFNAICAMPTNLYGPNDNFDLMISHVVPALIRKFHEAKLLDDPVVVVWGTGNPRREFLHADDLADACLFLMDRYDELEPINVGWSKDVSIRELAYLVRDVVGYQGDVMFDTGKPDGTPRKLLDTTRMSALGWQPRIELREGIAATYEWFRTHSSGTEVRFS